MADLTKDAPLRIWGVPITRRFILDTTSTKTIYKGQPMIVDQNVDATGPICGFVDAITTAVNDVFIGIAAEGHVITAGDTEDIPTSGIEVYIEPTIVGFKSTVFTDGVDAGKSVTMSDSGTLSTTTLANPAIGKLMWVSDGYAYVELSLAICTGAGA